MSLIPKPLTSKSGKNLILSQLLVHRVVRTEEFPTIEPLEEVLAVSMFDSPELALERGAEDFDEEEDIEDETLELSEFKKPS